MGGNYIAEEELLALVARREAIPGVERLQTLYTRYSLARRTQAQAASSWSAALSRKNYEHHARLEQQHFLPGDHLLFTDLAPESVSMRIVQAPAEFALPVKQDRRLSPSFKVKVEVKFRSQVSVPLTLRAFIVTQHDKDNILSWQPDDLDQDKKKFTELKGTTSITHYFEASSGNGRRGQLSQSGGPLELQQQLAHPGKAVSPAMLLQLWNGNERGGVGGGSGMQHHEPAGAWQQQGGGGGNLSIKPIDLALAGGAGALAGLSADGLMVTSLQGGSHGLGMASSLGLPDGQVLCGTSGRDAMGGTGMLGARSLPAESSGQGGDLYMASMLGMEGGWHTSQVPHGQLNAQMLQELQQLQQQQQQQLQLQQLQQQLQHILIPQQQQEQQQAQQGQRQQQSGPIVMQQQPRQQQQEQQQLSQRQQAVQLQAVQQGQQAQQELQTLEHEFEFSNLEFVRPTRMNKVYMAFACTLMDMDLIYTVYNVPTIGICRAEQREKACQKLGMTMPHNANGDAGPSSQGVKLELEMGRKRDKEASYNRHHYHHMHGDEAAVSDVATTSEAPMHKRMPMQSLADVMDSDLRTERGASGISPAHRGDDDAAAVPYSRAALRDWILEQYETTGLTRRLSELDLKALLSQAGFPSDAGAEGRVTVSRGQWEEFAQQFMTVLALLQQIANVWNMQEPCIISGFDMDRLGTIQALSSEPAGTFICRFSMSQPGCLVLTCKTLPGHPCSDKDNLLHAIIKIDDLYERRVDTWIRDFAGASHVLDVYRQKRVDKRKVFASNYTHLRGLGGDPA